MKCFLLTMLVAGSLSMPSWAADKNSKGTADQACQKSYRTEMAVFKKMLAGDQQRMKQALKELQVGAAQKAEAEASILKIFVQDNKATLKKIDLASDAVAVPLCAVAGSGFFVTVAKQGGKMALKKSIKASLKHTVAIAFDATRVAGPIGLVMAGVCLPQLTLMDKYNVPETCSAEEERREKLWQELQDPEFSKQCVRIVDLPETTLPVEKGQDGKIKMAPLAKLQTAYLADKKSIEKTYVKKIQQAGQDQEKREQVVLQYVIAQARLARNYGDLADKLSFCPSPEYSAAINYLDESRGEEDDTGSLPQADRFDGKMKNLPGNQVLPSNGKGLNIP